MPLPMSCVMLGRRGGWSWLVTAHRDGGGSLHALAVARRSRSRGLAEPPMPARPMKEVWRRNERYQIGGTLIGGDPQI